MYNPEYKIPRWVKYELLASETDGKWSRKGLKFTPDPSISFPKQMTPITEDLDGREVIWLQQLISNGAVSL